MSRANEMRELFARRKDSGKSLMAFGKLTGVSYAKLLSWRRRFESETVPVDAELVPVEVVADRKPSIATPGKIEIWLSNGVTLDVPVGFDEGELRRLIGALQSC